MWELSQSREGMRTGSQTDEAEVSVAYYMFCGD
jgi:hypothetical protein